jgi:hypothetical protein
MARKRTGRRSRSATRGVRRATRGARRGRARTSKQQRRGRSKVERKPERRSRSRKKSRRGSKKLNPYMRALKQARDNEEESFTYNGKTYKRKYAKTGMAIYKAA